MATSEANALRISGCPARRRREALELVFSRRDALQRADQVEAILDSAVAGRDELTGLLEARRAGRLVGAVLAVGQPGRTALVWPPRLAEGEPAETAAALMRALIAQLTESPTLLAQALLECNACQDATRLEEAGFFRAADLLYLVCPEPAFQRTPPNDGIEVEPFSEQNRDRFKGLVEATYEQTLDCPRLNGMRQIADVLEGYQATGAYSPERWLLFREKDRDLGCLILADFPEQDQWELVYMGVAPECRGRGLGRTIVQHAQWLVRQSGRKRLVLAVDAANEPAIRVYQEAGFQTWDRRCVYLHVLSVEARDPHGRSDPRAG